ncbi:hypothetical protein ACFX13_010992 [Malus domestica]|uniref:LysM domain-containing protein n=1 Tax=Malus domestica TaxID=3750 RepID=A0A498ID28_MALDO|nr:hypothetical protein DVH24_040210 [Malus domestica]
MGEEGMLMESEFCSSYADQVISSSLHNRSNNSNSNPMSASSSSSSSPFLPVSSPPRSTSPALVGGGGGGAGYIEHVVSKFDTLAGVAIKYGVEVADIKKMNGLVTDRQMFGLRFLQIPLPGRHPPSPCLSDGSKTPGQTSSDQNPTRSIQYDLVDSFWSLRVTPPKKPSPAMNSLQSYYGLKPRNQNSITEGFEMAVYKNGGAHYLEEGRFLGASPASDQPLRQYRKSRSLVKLDENGELCDSMSAEGDSEPLGDKWIRRRQKSEADFSRTPEKLLGGNSGSASSAGFSAISGQRLALRPTAANRTALGNDVEAGGLNPIPVGMGDSLIADGLFGVRKSSSTSNLQDHESSGSASIWSTSKWSLKPDLQAFSTAGIAKPIYDGLPKPITGRRKTALD